MGYEDVRIRSRVESRRVSLVHIDESGVEAKFSLSLDHCFSNGMHPGAVEHTDMTDFVAHQPEFAVEVVVDKFKLTDATALFVEEINTLCDVSFELLVVVKVEITTLSLTALLSATEIRIELLVTPDPVAEMLIELLTPLESATEIKRLCEVSFEFAVVRLSDACVPALAPVERAIEVSTESLVAAEFADDAASPAEPPVDCAVEVLTESLTAFESAVDACKPAETALESAVTAVAAFDWLTVIHVPSC